MSDDISIGKLVSPEEYIDYYYSLLKSKLQSNNIQISKTGFIGFLLNLMGFTQYDIKNYYDNIFKESFVSTSSNLQNLYLHSSLYNYQIETASPSSITGNLKLDLSYLPPTINILDREIVLQNLKVKINSIIFTLKSKYTIVNTFCKIEKSDGEIYYIPYNKDTGIIPIVEFYQYDDEIISFRLPYYSYGTHYQKIINLENSSGYIYEIDVQVKIKGNDLFETFAVSNNKYQYSYNDKVVFIYHTIGQIIIEFGSGIHGLYIPEAEVKIDVKITLGSTGNISETTIVPYDGIVKIYDYYDKATVYNVGASDIVKVLIDYSSGGRDLLSGEELRKKIIEHIHTRNNLISETDYNNILKKYIDTFIIIFRKTHIIDNIIYCFLLLRDLYQIPVYTKSISIKHLEFNPLNSNVVYKPSFNINNINYISPFIYIFDNKLLNYPGYVYFENYSIYFSIVNKIIDENIEIPPLSLKFEFSANNNYTKVFAKSYQKISQYQLYISIPQYNIFDECMLCYDDVSHVYNWYTSYNGIVIDCFDIEIKIYYVSKYYFNYKHNNICLLYDISPLLTLTTFKKVTDSTSTFSGGGPRSFIEDEDKVIQVPVLLMDVYNEDPSFYDTQLLNLLSKNEIVENRCISDTLQFRLLNTEIIPNNIVKSMTKQQYDFSIKLPLKLTVTLSGFKNYFVNNNIDSITATDDLKLALSKVLLENYSGLNVIFYQSKIIDTIHNFEWVKHCSIQVTDSNDIPVVIPDSSFEMIDQNDVIFYLNKEDAVDFCPVYMYWDINNIKINCTFE